MCQNSGDIYNPTRGFDASNSPFPRYIYNHITNYSSLGTRDWHELFSHQTIFTSIDVECSETFPVSSERTYPIRLMDLQRHPFLFWKLKTLRTSHADMRRKWKHVNSTFALLRPSGLESAIPTP